MTDIVDMTDIVERLREQVASLQAGRGYEASIAQVEIERLTAERDVWKIACNAQAAEVKRLREELADVRADAALLRGHARGPLTEFG